MQEVQTRGSSPNRGLEMSLREHLLAQQSGAAGISNGPSTYPPPPSASAPPPDNPYQNSDSASPQNNLDPNVTGQPQQLQYGMNNDSAGDESMGGGAEGGIDSKGKRELSTSKRAAQNRAAQRAFRQRKEGYIKKLEEQVKEFQNLEQSYRGLQNENYQLREYVLILQSRLLENQSDFPPAPSHINLAPNPAAAPPTGHPDNMGNEEHHIGGEEQQLRRELQQHTAPPAPIAPGPEPPRQAPIDHLGAAAARAVELEAKRPQESPYGLGNEYPSKRPHLDGGDSAMSDAKPQ